MIGTLIVRAHLAVVAGDTVLGVQILVRTPEF